MIAKLIVHGGTREQALARLDEALAQTHIVGLATNVQFLRHVVRSPSFAKAKLDTALIQREQAVLFDQEPLGLPLAAAARSRRPCCRRRPRKAPTRSAGATAGARMASRCGLSSSSSAASRQGRADLSARRRAEPDGRQRVAAALAFTATPQGTRHPFRRPAPAGGGLCPRRDPTTCSATRRDADHDHRPAGACRRSRRRNRPAHGADAGQGGVVRRQGRRQGQQGPGAGGDGGDEDGAHHRRAGRWRGGRTDVRAGRPGGRRRRAA